MGMSEKNFVDLADTLREVKENSKGAVVSWEELLEELVRFCKRQNPRFDEERWLDYLEGSCGPSGGRAK